MTQPRSLGPTPRVPATRLPPWEREGAERFLLRLGDPSPEVHRAAAAEFLAVGPEAVLWLRGLLSSGLPSERRLRPLVAMPGIAAFFSLFVAPRCGDWMTVGYLISAIHGGCLAILAAGLWLHRRQVGDLKQIRRGILNAAGSVRGIRDPSAIGALLALVRKTYSADHRLRDIMDAGTLASATQELQRAARHALAGLLGTEAGARGVSDGVVRRRLRAELTRAQAFRHRSVHQDEPLMLSVVRAYRWVTDPTAVRALEALARRDGGPPHHTPPCVVEAARESLAALQERLKLQEDTRTLPRPSAPQADDLATLPVVSVRKRAE